MVVHDLVKPGAIPHMREQFCVINFRSVLEKTCLTAAAVYILRRCDSPC
jgi:hypothetical protein